MKTIDNLTTAEACAFFGCSESTLYRLARTYRIRRLKHKKARSGMVRWPRAELLRVQEQLTKVMR